MYTALIVDDEPHAIGVLRRSLELFCPQFTTIREARDREEALLRLADKEVDLTFLDIQLKKDNGIDIYPELARWCKNIIFVTAFDEYAVSAFKTRALHYLLKPVSPSDLEQAVERADLAQGKIIIYNLGARTVLAYSDIRYLRSDGPYVHFHTTDGRTLTGTRGLKKYAEQLKSKIFFRTHQSFLVNLNYVNKVSLEEQQSGVVYLKGDDTPISIAKRRRAAFLRALEEIV